ncbi:MAG: YhfC family intramembrane metalloprotease [Nitrososphaerota archaeon]|nr:YhfC family intramembrane metalloprotease [Nitrososphaerota archaeon]
MENINPIFILQPILVIIFSSAIMGYWYKKRRFHKSIWLYTLIAYAGAIALKYAVQLPTIHLVLDVGPTALGIYYGVQTVVFEVGLAYALAYFAVKRGKLDHRDSEAYGSGLAFWENVGFLSVFSLINLVAYYFLISGGGSLAQLIYDQLVEYAPAMFSSNSQALSLVALGTVERLSSAMFHIAWGYLCVMAVVYRKKKLLLIALPMGFIDFLVPFAGDSMLLFEVVLFILASASLFVAWYVTKDLRRKTPDSQISPTVLTIDAQKESG